MLKVRGEDPFVLGRADAYIGVLIDDLVTKGTQEPYRIFTSRAEHRLLLREDNADYRLMEFGRAFGLVEDAIWQKYQDKRRAVDAELERLANTRLRPSDRVGEVFAEAGTAPLREAAALVDILRRPELNYRHIELLCPPDVRLSHDAAEHVEAEVKYDGYIKRQHTQVDKLKRLESMRIPADFDFADPALNLSTEGRQKLAHIRPQTLGQAARVSGVSPADVSSLMVLLHAHAARTATG